MNKILKFLGAIIIIVSVIVSLYLGVFVMLYGGIVQIINNINPPSASAIAIGILKIIFCELPVVIFVIGYIIGGSLINI